MRIFDSAEDESIIVGDDIEVKVLEINEDYVRLAISSPAHDPAYREETIFLDEEPKTSLLEFAGR